ncbi:hypothetical protein NO1_2287, partial [Candidatus Termititenax aidoneus]
MIMDKPYEYRHAGSDQPTYRLMLPENIEAEVREIIRVFRSATVYVDAKKFAIKYQSGPLTLELGGNGGLIEYSFPAEPDKPARYKAGHVLWSLMAENMRLKLRDREININAAESAKCYVSAYYVDPSKEAWHVYIEGETEDDNPFVLREKARISELHIRDGRVRAMKLAEDLK